MNKQTNDNVTPYWTLKSICQSTMVDLRKIVFWYIILLFRHLGIKMEHMDDPRYASY
jgi:hypothetical protein